MEQVYLSERNLRSLLSKLERKKAGESTACTIIKNDMEHPVYPQSKPHIRVTAVTDEEYYTDRPAGKVHPKDEPKS